MTSIGMAVGGVLELLLGAKKVTAFVDLEPEEQASQIIEDGYFIERRDDHFFLCIGAGDCYTGKDGDGTATVEELGAFFNEKWRPNPGTMQLLWEHTKWRSE